MSKTSKRRPRDPKYCSLEQFDENWQQALGRRRTQTIITEDDVGTFQPTPNQLHEAHERIKGRAEIHVKKGKFHKDIDLMTELDKATETLWRPKPQKPEKKP